MSRNHADAVPGSGLARDYPPQRRFAWRYVLPAVRFLPGVNSTRMPSRAVKRRLRARTITHNPPNRGRVEQKVDET
jgi:hypothetical protein